MAIRNECRQGTSSDDILSMPKERRLDLRYKIAYGMGSIAFGIKANGFEYFLMIFYSQVMGVSAYLVSLALLIALIVDAMSDPLMGYASDNTRSRWGRRHPFMYAAALPAVIAYYFVWNPPYGLEGDQLFPYIVAMAVLVRILFTIYEIPSSALVAEMTDDYDERTSLLSYRHLFGWAGGTLMAAFATIFLLVPTDTITNGMFNAQGYGQLGYIAATVMLLTMILSSAGTHKMIPLLRTPPAPRKQSLAQMYREVFETLASRSFLALFAARFFQGIAAGIVATLAFYLWTFLWGFSAKQIGAITLSAVLSALCAFVLAPRMSKTLGKKRGAITIGVIAFSLVPAPVLMRLLELMPDNSSSMLFPLVLGITMIDVALIITYRILFDSMIADLVEDSEIKTRRRNEGVFFSAVTFVQKLTQGIGAAVAGVLLTVSEFPVGTAPDQLSHSVFNVLGWLYVTLLFGLYLAAISCQSLYHVDREKHESNLKRLASRATSA